MQRYRIKTSEKAAQKLEAAGGDDSLAKAILDGLKWRLGRDPKLGSYIMDAAKNIRMVESKRRTRRHPIVRVLYQIIDDDEYYDMIIIDLLIIP
ncbi:MAG: hypothetical protein ACLQVJ_26110 [Syntrophobacteraceae bacterium]